MDRARRSEPPMRPIRPAFPKTDAAPAIPFTPPERGPMRHIIYALVAIAIVATFATSRFAFSQGGTVVCRPGGGCLTTTAAVYNSCVDLAIRRGVLLIKSDRHTLDRFVYQCVAGRVTR
jgi:hypothetical protein